MRIIKLLILSSIILVSSCKNASHQESSSIEKVSQTNHPAYVDVMEEAHNKDGFFAKETVCFNLDMTFGTSKSKFKIFTTPNSSNIKIEKSNGITSLLKDGVFYTNADSTNWQNEQFGLFTYHYFFMTPFKLSDPGTKWDKMSTSSYDDNIYNTAMLTFEKGTGDTPDDWYILHSNPESSLIDHMGYIVTGGGMSQEEAEKHAHAIKYDDYRDVDGVPMSHHWKFYDYDKSTGLGENQIGEGILKNVLFMDIFEDTYDTSDLTRVN